VNSTQERDEWEESTFVTFDFEGEVVIEVTSLNDNVNSVLIRPDSQDIAYNQNGETITFNIDKPQKLSLEINGDRYSNLQIFANDIAPPIPNNATIYPVGIYSDIQANSNDTLYFMPGAIIRGNISVVDKNNVQIMGRGIIDMIDYRKRYDTTSMNPPYESKPGISIRRSQNVGIDGIIINDPQAFAVEIIESDTININNLKAFTRVLWGDGIDMVGTSNVTINDCYLRTSDDCIAIYASRVRDWPWQNKDALNITVTNSALYADAAHPIEIGWHGNQGMNGYYNPDT
jgi:polygalacturonase